MCDVYSAGGSLSEPAHVDLYCSIPPAASAVAAAAATPTYGSCTLHGTVDAIAYVHKRDSAAKALSELKQDITRSLTARLQMLENEAASAAHEAQQAGAKTAAAAGGQAGKGGAAAAAHPLLVEVGGAGRMSRGLLRRVLMPWEGLGGIQV